MASINPVNVLLLLLDHYKPKYPEDSPVNEDELSLQLRLQDTIDVFAGLAVSQPLAETAEETPATSAYDETVIVKFQPVNVTFSEAAAEEISEEDDALCDSAEELAEEASDLKPSKKRPSNVAFEYKKRALEYWNDTTTGEKRALSDVKEKFDKVGDNATLHRWTKQMVKGGSRRDKLTQLVDKTVELVRAAKERGESIPDWAIQQYALQANLEVKVKDFNASSTWVAKFRQDCPDGLGTRSTRVNEVRQRLLIKCRDEMKGGRILSDKEIKTYALEINAVVKEPTLKFSRVWIAQFRKRFRVKSRIKYRKPSSTRNGVPIDTINQ